MCACVCVCVCVCMDEGGGYGLWEASCPSSLCLYQKWPLSIPDLTLVWSAMFACVNVHVP